MPENFQKLQILIKILEKYNLKPDLLINLQNQTKNFENKKWISEYKRIPLKIRNGRFLYIFFKNDAKTIYGFYIGKSKKKKLKRLKQHRKGLQAIENQRIKPDEFFYSRMYKKFFREPIQTPLYLALFDWKKHRILKNIFPFPIDCNLSNGESLLTSSFSAKFPQASINRDFVGRLRWAKTDLRNFDITPNVTLEINEKSEEKLWNLWCNNWFVTDALDPRKKRDLMKINHIPLFNLKDKEKLIVNTYNKNGKIILQKSQLMLDRIENAVGYVENAFNKYVKKEKKNEINNKDKNKNKNNNNNNNNDLNNNIQNNGAIFTDGLLYMAYILRKDIEQSLNLKSNFKSNFKIQNIPKEIDVIPIYIGKTESLGRTGNFSTNLKGITQNHNRNYFARWGYDNARHIGGLSYQFFKIPNKYPSTDYESWIKIMFNKEMREKGIPQLNFPVYFSMKPWYPYNISFCGKTRIFTPGLESILIALGRNLFPAILINKAGR